MIRWTERERRPGLVYRERTVGSGTAARKVFEHREVAEHWLGRALRPDEHVHHEDGNGLNNSPDNLIVLTRGAHAALHHARSALHHARRRGGPHPMLKYTIPLRLVTVRRLKALGKLRGWGPRAVARGILEINTVTRPAPGPPEEPDAAILRAWAEWFGRQRENFKVAVPGTKPIAAYQLLYRIADALEEAQRATCQTR